MKMNKCTCGFFLGERGECVCGKRYEAEEKLKQELSKAIETQRNYNTHYIFVYPVYKVYPGIPRFTDEI